MVSQSVLEWIGIWIHWRWLGRKSPTYKLESARSVVCPLSPHLLHWSDPSQWSYRSSPGESLHLPSWRTPRAARWGPWSQKAHWRWRGKCRDQRRGRSSFRGTPYFWCPCSDGRPPGSCREPRRWSCRREPAGPRSSGRRWWPGSCSRWSRRRCDCRDSSERLATGTRLTIGANIEMNIDIYYSRLGASSPPIILPSVSPRSFPNWGLAPARLRQASSTSIIIVGSQSDVTTWLDSDTGFYLISL